MRSLWHTVSRSTRTAARSATKCEDEACRPRTPLGREDHAALLGFWGLVISTVINSSVQLVLNDRDGLSLRPAEPAVGAVIVHTHAAGAWLYREPSTKSIPQFHLSDGEVVDVLCQRREGEIVYGLNPERGQPAQWPVWNRLSNGLWLPDLWTSLPKVPGDTPPASLPRC